MKLILVPLDFSDVAGRVVDMAASLARALGAEIHLVHVAAPDPLFVGYDAGPEVVRDRRAERLREEHRTLQEIAARLTAQGIETHPHLVEGSTVETICSIAHKLGVDLIVMGSHGRGALYQAIVGSVSAGVLRQSAAPVLLVPSRIEAKR